MYQLPPRVLKQTALSPMTECHLVATQGNSQAVGRSPHHFYRNALTVKLRNQPQHCSEGRPMQLFTGASHRPTSLPHTSYNYSLFSAQGQACMSHLAFTQSNSISEVRYLCKWLKIPESISEFSHNK